MPLSISSPVFADHEPLPAKYTCDGDGISPPLVFSGVPENTKSLVLVVDDPDAPDPAAPRMIWVHWILYNLPPDTSGLPEGVPPYALPEGTRAGITDSGNTEYGSPCPPTGTHRYIHHLYALDIVLPDMNQPAKPVLLAAMAGHVLEKADLAGLYRRKR
ncbi:MAG: hypothetical protein A2018_00015 [Alphaproteobacteria bacterium GWF2_58_20]|nr:MAG: hypothetical protein A2018_00015 [Alphaproteobacteria bacterium GWF2_58_20]